MPQRLTPEQISRQKYPILQLDQILKIWLICSGNFFFIIYATADGAAPPPTDANILVKMPT